jgi:hypothetical protein
VRYRSPPSYLTRLLAPGGGSYEGEWAHGEAHGRGVFVYPSGSRFEGTLYHGRPETGKVISQKGLVTRRFRGGEAVDVDELVEFENAELGEEEAEAEQMREAILMMEAAKLEAVAAKVELDEVRCCLHDHDQDCHHHNGRFQTIDSINSIDMTAIATS